MTDALSSKDRLSEIRESVAGIHCGTERRYRDDAYADRQWLLVELDKLRRAAPESQPAASNTRVLALRHLHDKLKSGEYDGTDVMAAWVAVEDLACLLERATSEPPAEQSEWPLITRIKADIIAHTHEDPEDGWMVENEQHRATLDLLYESIQALQRASQPPAAAHPFGNGTRESLQNAILSLRLARNNGDADQVRAVLDWLGPDTRPAPTKGGEQS